MAKTLYICYFGLLEPLVQAQVLPYLREIKKDGVEASILTFEPDFTNKWNKERINEEREKLAAEGIDWHCLAYHKRPSVPATLYDIFRGTLFVRRFLRMRKPDILHGRVHLPTLMGALARKLSRHKPKLLFDIRGFFPEEYTDAGVWPKGGWLYRGVKRVERWLLKESDGFVILTEKAREIMFPESKETGHDKLGRPVEVIPCCVDFDARFSGNGTELRTEVRKRLGIEDRFVITHVGALGGLYLTEEIADLLATAKEFDSNTFAMFLTQTDPKQIIDLLRARGFTENDQFVTRVKPTEVPEYLFASDIALSFVRSGYATQSRSPTKIPEYLACGLPIIANPGVGDVDQLIRKNGVGSLVEDFGADGYAAALRTVEKLGNINEQCRRTAKNEFDLKNVGGTRYRRLYARMLGMKN